MMRNDRLLRLLALTPLTGVAGWALILGLSQPLLALGLLTAAASGALAAVALRPSAAPAPPPPGDGTSDPGFTILAAGIAHELGQPLSAARVDIEGLHLLRQLGREPDAEHSERVLSRVGICILSMTQIVEHLRSLADPTDGRTQRTFDLREVCDAVMADRERWNSLGVVVTYERPTEAKPAYGDPLGLRLILINLLRNAVEAVATVAHGTVRLSLAEARVQVADNGPGIPDAQRSAIFHPFVSSKGRRRGIGLSLARISAERMGASVGCDRAAGGGTIFTVTLRPQDGHP